MSEMLPFSYVLWVAGLVSAVGIIPFLLGIALARLAWWGQEKVVERAGDASHEAKRGYREASARCHQLQVELDALRDGEEEFS